MEIKKKEKNGSFVRKLRLLHFEIETFKLELLPIRDLAIQ